jgi:hypothetical protein
MIDMGRKMSSMEVGPSKNEKSYPSVSIDMGKMKELKDCKMGDEVMMMMKCKVVGMSKYGNGSENCSLDIIEAEITENDGQPEADNKDELGDA